MAEKNLESLIVKIVKKVIKKELRKIDEENLPVISVQKEQPIDAIVATVDSWEDNRTTEEIIDDIYTNQNVNLPAKEDLELERKLRELKFKQELRKDWVLFLVRDVIVFHSVVIFIFVVAGYYAFVLVNKL
ncbi:MAG TPA: hypothetical protein VK184_20400 [Nostocaceae cyanobacterium]|nr:hypothetical protein [Nostocaceae cyanobacterium]